MSIETQPTLSFQRVLQRAVCSMFNLQVKMKFPVPILLVAIFSEQESHAAYLLRKHDVSRLDVVDFLSLMAF